MIYYKGPVSQWSLEVYTADVKEAKLKKVKDLHMFPRVPKQPGLILLYLCSVVTQLVPTLNHLTVGFLHCAQVTFQTSYPS